MSMMTCSLQYFYIFELTLMKLTMDIVLHFQSFLPGVKDFIENNFKKMYKFLKMYEGYN